MAAYIKLKRGRECQWHVGAKLPFTISEVKNVELVQVDGDEQDLLLGVLGVNGVLELTGNEAKMYCLMIYHLFHSPENPDIDRLKAVFEEILIEKFSIAELRDFWRHRAGYQLENTNDE
jgi:hypothetical protein